MEENKQLDASVEINTIDSKLSYIKTLDDSIIGSMIARFKKRYPEAAVDQICRIYMNYDKELQGKISVTQLPGICCDLNVKPWRALKEIEVVDGFITLESFIDWWFRETIEHTKEEEAYISHVFDNCDSTHSGQLMMEDIVKLGLGLKIKPWHLFRQFNLKDNQGLTKKQFLNWWFSKDCYVKEKVNDKATPKAEKNETKKTKKELLQRMEELNKEMSEIIKLLGEEEDPKQNDKTGKDKTKKDVKPPAKTN